jgi:hypothetical protein
MNQFNNAKIPTALLLGIVLLTALIGCVGYVDGGYGGGAVIVPGPDVYLFGGGYDRGGDARGYSHRGAASRGGGGHGGGHGGGGGHR